MDYRFVLALLIAYLLGSIPFAQIIASRVSGKDLREVGSRNVGTRNLTRTAGLGWGALGASLDFLKGLAAMAIGTLLVSYPLSLFAGFAAVAGHNWPTWLRFRGGKGLATAIGATASVALYPELLITVAIGWAILHVTKNVVLTAIVGFASILILVQYLEKPIEITWFVLGLAALVLLAAMPEIIAKLNKKGKRAK